MIKKATVLFAHDENIDYTRPAFIEAIANARKFTAFENEEGDTSIIRGKDCIFIIMGCDDEADSYKKVAKNAVVYAMANDYTDVDVILPNHATDTDGVAAICHETNDTFTEYKTDDEDSYINQLRVFGVKDAIEHKLVAEGTKFARMLVSMPPNHLKPSSFVELVQGACIDTDIEVEDVLVTERFGGLHAVAAGSDENPRLLCLRYTGTDENVPYTAIVGKGLTFDAGGLNLKPSGSMADMHTDMAGGAVAVGTILAAHDNKLPVNLVAVIPLSENKTGSKACRPGDVIQMYDGTTVEILNTDAEGRLILADAIAWVKATHDPEKIIDVATLTGACVVALGEKLAAIITNTPETASELVEAGERVDEYCHILPMHKAFKGALKSKVADIINTSTIKGAGTITAGMFLHHFAGDTPWIHLDIAGVARADGKSTGFGVKLLYHYIKEMINV